MSLIKIRAALETALDAIVGLIPAATITTSVSGLFTTNSNHLLVSGMSVTISNHSTINGVYLVEVLSGTTFSLKNKITKVAVTGSNGTGGTVKANLTAWEDVSFEPLAKVPYQCVWLVPATPENPTYGSGFYREIGYMQIDLYYPKDEGTLNITTRAMLLRDTFARGNTFVKDEVIVNVSKTPIISKGPVVDSYIKQIVKIPYWADIYPN